MTEVRKRRMNGLTAEQVLVAAALATAAVLLSAWLGSVPAVHGDEGWVALRARDIALGAHDVMTEMMIALQLRYQDLGQGRFHTVRYLDEALQGGVLRILPGTTFVVYSSEPRELRPDAIPKARVVREIDGFSILRIAE